VGRHSSPEQSHFLRSVAGWLLPWMLVAVVAGVAVWVTLDALTGDTLEAEPPGAAAPAPEPAPTRTREATPESSPTPQPTPSPKREKPKERPEKEPERLLIAEGITVQVLNATSSADAENAMAARLDGLGFEVLVTGAASRPYDDTTVYWSYDSARPAAVRLARRFGWVAALRPDNLSTSVALHVVVGADEA
jgi:hypothetical protein